MKGQKYKCVLERLKMRQPLIVVLFNELNMK